MIRNATIDDAKEICDIYNYYVENTTITFEEEAVSKIEMRERISAALPDLPWIVFIENDNISGYAYGNTWKSRCVYKYSVETTVYLDKNAVGKGIGHQLYKELLSRIKKQGYHAVIGAIALPNDASIALHERFGFEKTAHFKEVGYKFRKWIDVGYWQLIIKENAQP